MELHSPRQGLHNVCPNNESPTSLVRLNGLEMSSKDHGRENI